MIHLKLPPAFALVVSVGDMYFIVLFLLLVQMTSQDRKNRGYRALLQEAEHAPAAQRVSGVFVEPSGESRAELQLCLAQAGRSYIGVRSDVSARCVLGGSSPFGKGVMTSKGKFGAKGTKTVQRQRASITTDLGRSGPQYRMHLADESSKYLH